jgi:hypothetical protein
MKFSNWLYLELLLSVLFFSCSNNDDNIVLVKDRLIQYDSNINFVGTHELSIQEKGTLELHNLTNVKKTDTFLFKNLDNGAVIPLRWGYKYAGVIGDENGYYEADSDPKSIYVGLGFNDSWQCGDYELWLVRQNSYQVLDQFKVTILKDVEIDVSTLSAGVFSVKANGWIDTSSYGYLDSLQIVDKNTKNTVEKIATTYVEGKSNNLSFIMNSEKYETGIYDIYIQRWNYDFIQKIGELDYFSYQYVESNPIKKDSDGKYYIKFTVDDISEGNTYAIVDMPNQENYYDDGEFDPAFWDEATKTYRLELKTDEDHLFGEFKEGMYFIVQLNINGNDVTVSGENKLDL